MWGHHTQFAAVNAAAASAIADPASSLISPSPHIELHHVNGVDQVVVAECKIKILQGFLLVPVAQDGVG